MWEKKEEIPCSIIGVDLLYTVGHFIQIQSVLYLIFVSVYILVQNKFRINKKLNSKLD
jgi:hypothetical protein